MLALSVANPLAAPAAVVGEPWLPGPAWRAPFAARLGRAATRVADCWPWLSAPWCASGGFQGRACWSPDFPADEHRARGEPDGSAPRTPGSARLPPADPGVRGVVGAAGTGRRDRDANRGAGHANWSAWRNQRSYVLGAVAGTGWWPLGIPSWSCGRWHWSGGDGPPRRRQRRTTSCVATSRNGARLISPLPSDQALRCRGTDGRGHRVLGGAAGGARLPGRRVRWVPWVHGPLQQPNRYWRSPASGQAMAPVADMEILPADAPAAAALGDWVDAASRSSRSRGAIGLLQIRQAPGARPSWSATSSAQVADDQRGSR